MTEYLSKIEADFVLQKTASDLFRRAYDQLRDGEDQMAREIYEQAREVLKVLS